MGISSIRGMVLVCLAALLLAGCTSTEQEEPDVPEVVVPTTTESTTETEVPVAVVPRGPTVQGTKLIVPLGDSTEELQGLFYFDFDQAIVKRAGHSELNRHAMAMKEDRSFRVRLEGHADERGTREYNLALAERRANAVRAYLQAQGVLSSQMEVISYGEEKPAAMGHNEQAWALNRRVEIVYK